MSKKWIAIVSRTEARIFNAEDMRKLYTLTNNAGREKNREFTSGKPGVDRNRSHAKFSTHSLTGEKSSHNEAAKKFAHKLNARLMSCCSWQAKDLVNLSDYDLKVLFLGKEEVWPPKVALQSNS